MFIVYYPNHYWLARSKFLNCDKAIATNQKIQDTQLSNNETRDFIIYADTNNNNKLETNKPVIVITADNYQHFFNTAPPLTRMLRRQINKTEYIALSPQELKKLDKNNDNIITNNENLNSMYFVIADVKNVRGYYATEMKPVSLGKIKEIKLNTPDNFTLYFDNKSPTNLKSTNQFIRWIGL